MFCDSFCGTAAGVPGMDKREGEGAAPLSTSLVKALTIPSPSATCELLCSHRVGGPCTLGESTVQSLQVEGCPGLLMGEVKPSSKQNRTCHLFATTVCAPLVYVCV